MARHDPPTLSKSPSAKCATLSVTVAATTADDVRLSDVEPSLTCTRCGKRRNVRSAFGQAVRMGAS